MNFYSMYMMNKTVNRFRIDDGISILAISHFQERCQVKPKSASFAITLDLSDHF